MKGSLISGKFHKDTILKYKNVIESLAMILVIIKSKCSTNCNLALVKDSPNYKKYNEQFDFFLKKWQEHAGAFEIVEENRLKEFEYNALREWLLQKENTL